MLLPAVRTPKTGFVLLTGLVAIFLVLAVITLFSPLVSDRKPDAVVPVNGQPGDTNFTVASFNVLGYFHTEPGGNHEEYADGIQRMTWATQLINSEGLDLVGFQELQAPQLERFEKLQGKSWDTWPGDQLTRIAGHNSIAWKTSVWKKLQTGTVPMPYFQGKLVPMPWVKLQHLRTGRNIYLFNNHLPADAQGPAEKWRQEGVRIEIALVNGWRAKDPKTPIVVTGDKNEREDYFCPVVARTDLQAANGGSSSGARCVPPKPTKIDWLMGSSEVEFSRYEALEGGIVDKITDHPVILAQATIAPTVKPAIQRVLVISVDGLTSRAIANSPASSLPNLRQLLSSGARTLDARTMVESAKPRANLVSLWSGRPIRREAGGHGIGAVGSKSTIAHQAAGEYVSSLFDRVHNYGMSTALAVSRESYAKVAASWGAQYGGLDPYGPDNGRNKLDQLITTDSDPATTQAMVKVINRSPKRLMMVSLSNLDEVGLAEGYDSSAYRTALAAADSQIGQLVRAVRSRPALSQSTLVVLTGTSGGTDKDRNNPAVLTNTQLPLVIVGPGVRAGTDLYTLNPHRARPGSRAQIPYSAPAQPIRVGDLANLVCQALILPSVPGSQSNHRQDLRFQAGR